MRFIGDDFRISVSAQHISVETKAFGPLALPVIPGVVLGEAGERDYSNTQLFITIWVSIEPGSMAEIDLGKTKLLGNGGALVLLPASIIRYIRYDDVHREREWEEVVSQQKIEADPDDFDSVRMELYKLTYEVTAAELESFVIQIGSFIVNGKTVQIPQITFKKAGSLELLSAPGA